MMSSISFAKSVCEQDPTYDMTAFANFVEITEGRKHYILHQTGEVSLNGERLDLSTEKQSQVKVLVDFILQKLPQREKEAVILMDALHSQFVNVVKSQLDGNSQLLTMLDNTHADATRTLGKAIKTKGNVTEFSANDFHKIIDRASGDFKLEMAKIVSKSVFTFNVGRNYKDIKYLGDQEWKKFKPEAKAFHKALCADLAWITAEKAQLFSQ
ncbi:hypothetical protein GCM10023338_16330 [Wohlfahrtiimonas larvae]|uniref:Uncharacterized protein n=2 Tax=Wohlfahrtiimonas larvae TaxID=1157986 RepID=A0ABP9MTK6_9GAMM